MEATLLGLGRRVLFSGIKVKGLGCAITNN